MTGNIQFIVFDWDGTLMDSEAQIVSCLHGAIDDLGLPPMSDDTVKNVIGLGLREAVDALVPGRDDRFRQAFVEAYRRHWFASDGSSLFAGAHEMLDRLREQEFLLGVATGKARRGLIRVLEQTGLTEYFDATRCADETASKPHPRMLLELMDELGMAARQTLMVGDTEYDMEMATNAGAGKVAVRSGVHSEERLYRHGPLVCLDSVTDLPAWMSTAGFVKRCFQPGG
ncbi:MAG TPA: HAD-IA family hydrolase [Gammaproteobacteria bacterium]|nr:HAD-IA family hydrolase [Gammaproteobacteria bacterium]